VHNIGYIDRGYEDFENNLSALNADITRMVNVDGAKKKEKI
jgi:UDP-N-acetylglucosamine enolpyruvyl transferase